jgi:predicted 3-demethylubiquinone-9 3-methyltransferase (glyoxalase superfamily)
MQKITPFLWFDSQAEEAMNFYTSIFPDSQVVSIKRYPDGPLEGPMKGLEGKVLTAVFELMGQRFMALDGGPLFKASGAISFYVECENQEEVDAYWNRLTEGGDPNEQQCGWLKDKFGFSWQIIPSALPKLMNDPDAEKAGRVMQAMLQMKKIDVAGLEAAYRGE